MLKSIDTSTTKPVNPMKPLYLLLTVVGSIVPWFWLLQDPTAIVSPTLFLQRVFANNVAAADISDLLISAIAFFCFATIELKRLGSSRLEILLYVGLTSSRTKRIQSLDIIITNV
jgi:Terpene cyclase DEP1